ncbi:NAD-dependent epimerase/dehydratase family protein [Kitasatospora sp. NPDC101235]|uniref:NAD-dependent epimerase/dehydratase family protein n=1 Tax=Kitasatospora sp. NPDC101235 TaxID=3364101 RepID=UPI0037F959F3
MTRVLVTGSSGFIAGHLVERLRRDGHLVRAAGRRATLADEFVEADLRDAEQCRRAVEGTDVVFALAANMGGIGWTHHAPAQILRDNLLISTHTIEAARAAGVSTLVYASSACVYPRYLQNHPDSPALREDIVFPADPDMSYGWEKLTGELLCETYRDTYGMDVKVARLHTVYGPGAAYAGPRAKALMALCAKVAAVEGDAGTIEVWGDGSQTRSFCHVDDCVEGLVRLAASDVATPVNIGSDERVTIAEVVRLIADAAGKDITMDFAPDRPVGPLGRSSDNTRCRELLSWAPGVPLAEGIRDTYRWVAAHMAAERSRAHG